ncbi:hypothetical protein CLOP_g15401 [Closterium sp. NIES-67]|nr:hypothetical protein CLOP_g15401 [Closterium sp. NIES-67]
MTPRADLLDEVKPLGKIKYVAAASGALLPVIGFGNAKVKGANGELVGLGNVLLVEGPAKTPLALVHMDVVGPTRAPSLSGSRYFLTIVDDHTRAVWADELQQPSRQVEVAVSEEEISGVTEEGGAAEVEQQQQHESPPRVPQPPERPRRDVRPPVRLTYGGRGKPNVVQAGSVVEQIEEDEIAHCYWAPIPEPKTREEALNGPNGEKWKASEDEEFGSLIENETWDLCDLPPGKKAITSKMIYRHKKLFHSMVGSLSYAANHTRPDIAFSTSRLASVVSRPSHEQLEAAKRLVRYVSATASVGLEYSGVRQRLQRGAADVKSGEMLLSCYTDASFNSVKADGTSIGGYVCLLGGGAVSWRSKKQNEVGLSSCETEYMALHHGAKEVVWLRRLLEELGVGQEKPTVVFCDNESAVKLAKNACQS